MSLVSQNWILIIGKAPHLLLAWLIALFERRKEDLVGVAVAVTG